MPPPEKLKCKLLTHEKLKCKLLMPEKLKLKIANTISDADGAGWKGNTICPFHNSSNDGDIQRTFATYNMA